jgi:hypothetical protein
MKAIKSFLLKVWAIVSAIKPEEAMVSPRLHKSEEVFKKLDHEGFFEALTQDIKGMQLRHCGNNSDQSIFSFTDAEFANAAESALSKIDFHAKGLTVGDFHQEVAKQMVRGKIKSGGRK